MVNVNTHYMPVDCIEADIFITGVKLDVSQLPEKFQDLGKYVFHSEHQADIALYAREHNLPINIRMGGGVKLPYDKFPRKFIKDVPKQKPILDYLEIYNVDIWYKNNPDIKARNEANL